MREATHTTTLILCTWAPRPGAAIFTSGADVHFHACARGRAADALERQRQLARDIARRHTR